MRYQKKLAAYVAKRLKNSGMFVFVALMEDLEENLEMENVGQRLMPEEVSRIAYISQRLADNSKDFLSYLEHVTAHAGSQRAPFYQVPSQTPAPTISPEIIAIITMRNQNPIPATFAPVPSISSKSNSRLGKLLDIPEYNGGWRSWVHGSS